VLGGAGTQRLSRRALAVTAQCNEACTLIASAKVTIGNASRSYSTKSVTRALGPGAKGKLKLRFPRKAVRAIRRALRRKRVLARVDVLARDAAGNVGGTARKVRIKR
jgi:hypothetical protein